MSTPADRKSILKEKKLQLIREIPIFDIFNKKVMEDILDFVPADGDVIVATYPKTGTNWTLYIVHQILTKGESFPAFKEATYTVMPCLQLSDIETAEKLKTRQRFFRHHVLYNTMKKNPKAKIIYVYRKPEDTILSSYYFTNDVLGPYFVELDDYVEDFLSGNVSYGHYFDHILSYYRHKDDGNIIFVSYEKLLFNRKEEILRIAKFLGTEYFDLLTKDESVMDKVIEHTNFSYMKKNLFMDFPIHPYDLGAEDQVLKKLEYSGKGTSGECKKNLKDDQLRRLTELAKEKLDGTDILSEWLNDNMSDKEDLLESTNHFEFGNFSHKY